jgi:hypothetical protein
MRWLKLALHVTHSTTAALEALSVTLTLRVTAANVYVVARSLKRVIL